jgi:hypothetical protein
MSDLDKAKFDAIETLKQAEWESFHTRRHFIMSDLDKAKFDALETLKQAEWESFHTRRHFEWKVCIALWTTYAAFIGTAFSGKIGPLPEWSVLFVAAVMGIGVCCHYFWISEITRANDLDRKKYFHFRDQMMERLGQEFPTDIKDKEQKYKDKKEGKGLRWSKSFQVCITILLTLTAILITGATCHNQNTLSPSYKYRVITGEMALQNQLDQLTSEGWEFYSTSGLGDSTSSKTAVIVMRKAR